MARKPNSMYRYVTQQAFTRREYTGGVPASRLLQFQTGTQREYPIHVELRAEEAGQIRSQALEAARIAAGRFLDKRVGRSNFYFKIRIFPHHILRENKQATGAGADRVSQGMRGAFGGNVGVAARVQRDQAIIELRTEAMFLPLCKQALRKASMKIATPCYLEYPKGRELAMSAQDLIVPRKALPKPEPVEEDDPAAEKASEEASEGEAKEGKGGESKGEKKDAKGDKSDKKDAKPKKGKD